MSSTEKGKTTKAVMLYRAGIAVAAAGLLLSFWGESQASGDLTVLASTPVGDIRIVDVVLCSLLVGVALFLLGSIYAGGKRIPLVPKRDTSEPDGTASSNDLS